MLKRKIYTTAGATDLTTVNSRLTVLENNTYEITYFEEFSATTGQVTVPTGGTIALNQFSGGVDAFVSTVSSSQPTGIFPQTSGGVTVDVSSFDASGNFTLSGTPSAYPIAIIYVFRITGLNLSNINNDNVVNIKDTNFQPLDSDLTSIAGLSPTNDDIIQRKSGAWTNRTITQLGADLSVINGTGLYIFMTSGDQTTTSDSLGNITELVTPTLEANSRYIINGFIHFGCNNTGGVFLAVDFPASSTMFLGVKGKGTSGTSYLDQALQNDGTSFSTAYNRLNSATGSWTIQGELKTDATTGVAQFTFASATAGQISTIYQLGTWIFIKKIA